MSPLGRPSRSLLEDPSMDDFGFMGSSHDASPSSPPGLKSSLRSSSSSQSERSISWSGEAFEIHSIKKVSNKDRKAYWHTVQDLEGMRREAAMTVSAHQTGRLPKTGKVTTRGLEKYTQGSAHHESTLKAAKELALSKQPAMYGFYSKRAVEKAQNLALNDALEAAEYQKEEANESPSSPTKKSKSSKLMRLLSH